MKKKCKLWQHKTTHFEGDKTFLHVQTNAKKYYFLYLTYSTNSTVLMAKTNKMTAAFNIEKTCTL